MSKAQGWRPLLLCLLLALAGRPVAAQDVEALYRSAATEFHRLRAAREAKPGDWLSVGRRFLAIHEAHPNHRRGAHALFSAGLAYREAYQAGQDAADLSQAVDLFQRFLGAYPEDTLADDCLMHIGDIFANTYRDPQVAYLEYRKVLERYPDGDQAALAQARAEALEPQPRPAVAETVLARAAATQPAATLPRPAPAESAAAAREPATLKRVQYLSTLDWTRVILTMSAPAAYRHAELPSAKGLPRRLYIDLPAAALAPELIPRYVVEDASLRQIRIGRTGGETVRVVLDVKDIERYAVKAFDLPLETKIVLDLHAKPQPVVARKEAPNNAAPRSGGQPGKEQARSLNRALGLKVRTIVVDPGHGGHDPGAVSFGLKEKEITLQIAESLRDVIRRRRPDLNVVLTREDDRFVPLQERSRIAREAGADLFVSIHINAHDIDRFSGIETYFLNLTTDSSALEVAARENASTEKQVSDLNAILLDLLRDTNIIESGRLAKSLQASIVGELHAAHAVRDLGVKQAPFMVLLGSDVPSVLLEAGFITNREENRRLREKAYQQQIAEGIYVGLSAYMDDQTIADHSPTPSAQAALARY